MKENYIYNLLLSLDQLGNSIIAGDHDETISSQLGKLMVENKLEGKPIAAALAAILNAIDNNHCLDAIEWDEGKTFKDIFNEYTHHRRDGKH